MTGRNQHHIPQFFQRGFGVKTSGKPKQIWKFTKTDIPEQKAIKRTAAEHDFYSAPSDDGSATLDDLITDVETPLSVKIAALRALPIAGTVDSDIAAEVISHLAPRTSHLHETFSRGVKAILSNAASIFSDTDNFKRLLGLDTPELSERFKLHVMPSLREDPHSSLTGLPDPVFLQIAFRLAKENFDQIFLGRAATLSGALSRMLPESDNNVRDSHNKALAKILDNNTRRDDLATLVWSVEAGPRDGTILPDCIAIGYERSGDPYPYMMADQKELASVVLPLTSKSLLVGQSASGQKPNVEKFNADAAACSHTFFLAAQNTTAYETLAATIGDRPIKLVDDAINDASSEYEEDELSFSLAIIH